MEEDPVYGHSDCSSDDGSLALSCGSSSFDDEPFLCTDDNAGVEPFRFEPYLSDPSDGESDRNDDEVVEASRLHNIDWCRCGHCSVMATNLECVCCHEIEKITAIFEHDEGITCITDHPGFSPACLNIYVLQIAYNQYKQQYRENIEDSSEKYRYTAYRQLARWAWGYIGKKIRVVLPSCAVKCIRNNFPDESENYTGFKPH